MVANMRQNITRIFGKNINNHHIIAIIKRWHHRENNRWGFVGTIIAYLRHASDRGVSLPRVGNIFDVTNPGLTTIAYLRHAARSTRPPPETNHCTASALAPPPETNHCTTSDIDSNHGIGTRPPPETNHCTASDIVSNHGIGF